MVSSISCQEKQQNVAAEVSAQPFPALPITPVSSKYFCFPVEPRGEPPAPLAHHVGGEGARLCRGTVCRGGGSPVRCSRPHGCCS